MSLAMQIFIALILAIVVGLLMQSHAEFAESYIKPFGTNFPEPCKVHRSSNRIILHYVWDYLHAGY